MTIATSGHALFNIEQRERSTWPLYPDKMSGTVTKTTGNQGVREIRGDTCDVSVALKLKPCFFFFKGALQEVSGSLCQKQSLFFFF